MSQQPYKLQKDIVKRVELDYIIYLPNDYGKERMAAYFISTRLRRKRK